MKNLLKLFTNKYVITAVLFLLLMLFFDQNDWFTQHGRVKELEKTQQKIDHLNNEIGRMDKDLKDLNSSNANHVGFSNTYLNKAFREILNKGVQF